MPQSQNCLSRADCALLYFGQHVVILTHYPAAVRHMLDAEHDQAVCANLTLTTDIMTKIFSRKTTGDWRSPGLEAPPLQVTHIILRAVE
jgi:alpha-galactosidase